MIVICAWCKKELSKTPGDEISHGMCKNCAENFEAESTWHAYDVGFLSFDGKVIIPGCHVSGADMTVGQAKIEGRKKLEMHPREHHRMRVREFFSKE